MCSIRVTKITSKRLTGYWSYNFERAGLSAVNDVIIRAETAADYPMIRQVNEAAFGGADEADLVEALRRESVVLLSVVAESDGRIVGHILFSRMSIETPTGAVAAAALAPVAVLPHYQRRGIGGSLIRYSLDAMRGLGERIVIVVGHPAYYPRFGFSTEQARALEHPFSPDAFMALELSPGALDRIRGRVRYPPPFGL
jgi:putative acetyltransferase